MFALLPGHHLFVAAFFGLIGAAGGTAVVAQVGRDKGSKKQPGLWKSWDGPPTTRLLRHRRIPGDITLEPGLRWQIQDWTGNLLPNEQQEEADPQSADKTYEEVVTSLRESTRDRNKFPLVFAENVNYGFRRNLWGMRPIGGTIAVALALLSWTILLMTIWGRPWPDPWWDVLVNPDSIAVIRLTVASANTALASFWLFWVKPSWVKTVADTYATRLMESVQTLRSS